MDYDSTTDTVTFPALDNAARHSPPHGEIQLVADIDGTVNDDEWSRASLIPDLIANAGSDGMVVDCAGNLYVTQGGVRVYSPEGDLIGTLAVRETFAESTAPAPTRTPSVTMQREPRKAPSSTTTGTAFGGSSTPPIPTPPARWTSAPIWAHEPTVAQVSTIVRGPTHAPMLT